MRRFTNMLVLAALIGAMCGCEKKPVEPPAPPPRIPSESEITAEFTSAYQPLVDAFNLGQAELPAGTGEPIANALRAVKSKHAMSQNGPAAIQKVTSAIEDLVTNANDRQLWGVVVAACDALQSMNPESSKIDRYRERALLQLNRPKVTISGSSSVRDKTVFFMDVYLPETKKTESRQQSVGDEFLGLHFVEVIGDNQGVKFEYKATGDVFTVMKKGA